MPKKPGRPTKRTSARRQMIIEALRKGNGYAQAAQAVGMTGECLREWRRDDATFAAECAQAEEWCGDVAENILYARGAKGETLALLAWLRAHRPERYHTKLLVSGEEGGAPITIDQSITVEERVPRVLILPDNSRHAMTIDEIAQERIAIAAEVREGEED